MRRVFLLLALGASLVAPTRSDAAGKWQTFFNPVEFRSIVSRADGVWWASQQAGLLRFDLAGDSLVEYHREPGALTSNKLNALATDRTGNLWIATDGAGLSRLAPDGVTWGIVNSFDGLPSDTVLSLAAQGDTLWIGTTKGLALWNGREISGSLPDPNTATFDTTFASTSITSVAVHDDDLWLGTRREIGRATISSGLVDWSRHSVGLINTDIENMASDGQQVFALASGAIYEWQENTSAWQQLGFYDSRSLSVVNGTVLSGTSNGILRWGGGSFDAVPGGVPAPIGAFPAEFAVTIAPNGDYYGGVRDHLYRMPAGGGWTEIASTFPIANDCVSILSDGVRAYVSTRQQGVSRWDGVRWRNWPIGQAIPIVDTTFFNPVFAYCTFLSTNGHKWVACHDQALEEIDDSVEPAHFTHHFLGTAPDQDRHTRAIIGANDLNGGTWFGMFTPNPDSPGQAGAGLDFYDRNGGYANFRDGRRVSGLAVDRGNKMWVGYLGNGVEIFGAPALAADTLIGAHALLGTAGLDVHGIVTYGDTAWVLTTTGLRNYKVSSQTLRLPILDLPSALSSPLDPHPMDVSPDGRLWLGTQAGLRVYRRNALPQDFTVANSPLPDNDVRTVFVERPSGVLWIATAIGLARFEPDYVPPAPPAPPQLEVHIYPNPAFLTSVGIALRIAGNAGGSEGEIYDITGRRLRKFDVPTSGRVFWNGRDEEGNLVRPGIYFLRAHSQGREATARFVLIH
jgi:hypothetical protein